jgi:hypothetical protein
MIRFKSISALYYMKLFRGFIFCTVCTMLSCTSQPEKANSHQASDTTLNLEEKINALKVLHSNLLQSKNSDSAAALYRRFFYLFPSKFDELVKIYGWDEANRIGYPLYDEYYSHGKSFIESEKYVGDSVYMSKIVGLCLNGYWDADMVSEIQIEARRLLLSYPVRVIMHVEKLGSTKEASFWNFYFDQPHPDEVMPVELDSIKNRYPAKYEMIDDIRKKKIIEWENH